jgi:PAS domain S-box-containing protein
MSSSQNSSHNIQSRISNLLEKLSDKENETDPEIIDLLSDIKNNKAYFYNIFNFIQDGIAIYEAVDGGDDFKIVGFNSSAEEIEGIKRDKLLGKRVTKVFPQIENIGLLDVFKKVWKTGVSQNHPVSFYEDNILVGWRDNYVFKLPSGEVVASYSDVTKQKLAEAKIVESELNTNSLINNINESIWSIDNEYNFIIVNDFFKKEYFKRVKIELEIGINALDLLTEEEFTFWKKQYDRALSGEKFSFEYSSTLQKKVHHYEVSLNPIIADKRITGVSALSRDITDRKLSEQKIRESEEKYRSIFDNDKMIMLLVNPDDQTIVDANNGAVKFYGWRRDELRKMKVHQINDMSPQEIKKKMQSVKKSDENYFEFRHKKKGGTTCNVSVIRGDIVVEGKDLFYILVTDITEKKKAEEETKKREENYRGIFNTSSDAIYIQDKNGCFLDVNLGVEKMYGYNREAFIGKTPEFISAEGRNDLEAIGKAVSKAFNGKEQSFEYWGKRKNGEIFPKEVRLYPGKFNGEKVVIAVGRDISERKLAEEKLRRSEEKFKNLLQFAPDAFVQGDSNGDFISCNEATTKLTGYGFDELLKLNMKDLFSKSTLNAAPFRYDLLKEGKVVQTEREMLCKNGDLKMIEMNSKMMNDGTMQSFIRDISERKITEDALKESEENFRLLFENSPQGIFIADYKGNIFDGNKALLEMLGSPSLEATKKINVLKFKPLEENGYAKLFRKCVRTNETLSFDISYSSKWGKTNTYSSYLIPLSNSNGKVERVYTIMEDITQRKEAEKALRESEAIFRNLSDSTSTAIFVYQENKFVFVNRATEVLTGYSKEELLKMNFWDTVHPDYCEEVTKRGKNRQKGKPVSNRNQFKIIKKDGQTVWIDFSGGSIKWAGKVAAIGSAVDITERKLAEGKLRNSEEKYKLISDITSDYIYESRFVSKNILKTVWVAGSFSQMTGYNLTEYNKAGGWSRHLHRDDVEVDEKAFNELLKNRKTIVKVRTYHKNGNIIWIKNSSSPIWDKKENKLIGVIGAAKDITEEKQNQIIQEIHSNVANAIVKSQNVTELFEIVRVQLHKIIDTTNFFIAFYDEKRDRLSSDIVRDEKDNIQTWSANKSISGIIINKRKKLFLYKEDIIKLANSGEIEIIGTLPEVWFGIPLRVRGQVVGVMAVQDYNNRNAFDKASTDLFEVIGNQLSLFLERNRAKEDSLRLSRAISQSPVSIVITNRKGEIEYVNPKFEKVSGYTFEEVFGENPRVLKSGEQTDEYYKTLWSTILSGKDWRGEFLNKNKSGNLYWENVVISPIANDKGEITHFVQIKEDITEKKEMIEELIKSKEKAEVSEKIKTEFLAQMSHEIRSPLNVILSFVGLLKEDLAETATEDMMYSFESIDSASARIIRTIDLILNMTDLQIGSYESSTKEINVVEILQNIRLEYKQFAERRGLDLRLNLKFNRKKITSDEYALTQIISNLVDNAIKYSDEGYIEIFAEKGKNRDLIVKIIDTGIGMSEEFLPNIFNSFTQEEQGYTRSYDGNGLGMALVKKYCDIINAEITVKSKKGKGSTFTIIIPNLKR